MEQFDLSLWLKDKSRKVVTKTGEEVKIIDTNAPDENNPIVGYIYHKQKWNGPWSWHIDGVYKVGGDDMDLFFADEKDELNPACDDQKPWPETLDRAIELYYYSYGNGKDGFDNLSLEKFKDIVKTFVEDYGTKSAWSEEDELMLNRCISDFEYLLDHDKESFIGRYKEQIEWLKVLKSKSNWKPSRIQFSALKEGLRYMPMESAQKDILEELYNDLKREYGKEDCEGLY